MNCRWQVKQMNQSMEHSRRRFLSIGDTLEKKAAASVSPDVPSC